MKLALVGYGSMGKLLHQLATDFSYQEIIIVDPNYENADAASVNDLKKLKPDIVIDFSLPVCATENIKFYSVNRLPAVIGTTGWYESLPEVEQLVTQNNSKLLWSSNFSIGVNAYFKIVQRAAEVFNKFDDYDIWGTEVHHVNKADSPSGTAKSITQLVLGAVDRKEIAVFDKLDRKPKSNELHYSSVRGGQVNFEHTLVFDSASDSVSIKHSARDRMGYVKGALQASKWLLTQEAGFYGFEDFMNGVLNG